MTQRPSNFHYDQGVELHATPSRPEEPGAKPVLYLGLAGAALAALCCAGPVLISLLGVVGLWSWGGWFGYTSLPLLAVMALLGVGVWILRRRRRATGCCTTVVDKEGV